jgi:hypothetical protein
VDCQAGCCDYVDTTVGWDGEGIWVGITAAIGAEGLGVEGDRCVCG